MKKTSIKKTNQVLSVLLSSCMLLSATTAASATTTEPLSDNRQTLAVQAQKTDVDTTIAFKPGWTWIDISPGNKLNRANDHYGYGDLTLDSDQQYEIINEFWVRDDGKVNSSSGKHEYDIFESGRSYTYGMELKAKDGYKFNKTAKYLIKDSWHFEDIDDAICTVSEDESILTIKNMHTTTFESLDNYKVIDTIEVNNATLTFNVGDTPKFTGKEPENSKYSIVEYWRDNVNGEGICTSPFFNQAFEKHIEKFKSGVNYEYSIYFRIDGDAWEEGYRLADSVTIKINGKDIDNIEDIDYNASVEAWTSNLISMTPTEAIQDNKVDTNIRITNTMLDIYPGNTPRGPLSDGTDAHGYGAKTNSEQYELTDEFWVRDDGKVNYYSDPYGSEGKNEYGTFEVGHSYTYGIELKAKSGYIFDKNAEYKVNVDGTDMTGTTSVVSEDGKTLIIKNIKTEEFKAPSADKEINTELIMQPSTLRLEMFPYLQEKSTMICIILTTRDGMAQTTPAGHHLNTGIEDMAILKEAGVCLLQPLLLTQNIPTAFI